MINLIWDLDGTVINSENEVFDSLLKAISENGLDINKAIVPLRIGPTIDILLKTSFSPDYLTEEKLNGVISSFRRIYDNSPFDKTPAFEGMENIFKDTRRYNHFILTNKPDFPSKRILEKLGFNMFVKRLVTPYSFGGDVKLPKSELFSRLISEENLEKEKSFGIGDMEVDCKAAHNAGIKAIGVLWGTGTKEELSKCEYIVKTVVELENLLGNIYA